MRGLLDIQLLTKALKSLAGLTGLSISIYDDRRNLLIAPFTEDALLQSVKSSRKGQELYNDFFSRHFESALKANDSFIAQGPTRQYHAFLPVLYKDIKVVAVAEAFYISHDDFAAFYSENEGEYGLTENRVMEWMERVSIIQLERVEKNIKAVHPLLESLLAAGCDKGELDRRWQWSRTIINLAANMKSSASVSEIHQTIVDTVIFLFGADTACTFSLRAGLYLPGAETGRIKQTVRKLKIPEANHFMARAAAAREPVAELDSYKLWRCGFPEEIISMYLFPVQSQAGFFGLLGVFNTLLGREEFDSISELCKLTASICGARHISEEYERKSDSLSLVSLKTSQLYFLYKDPPHLYENIVKEAASLVGAEKCSLMLPDESRAFLEVSAVKGVNEWLMKDVKVRIGEGISGKVFEQGMPILIDCEDRLKEMAVSPKSGFKTGSCLSVPLKIADEIIGTLNLSDKTSGEPFTSDDLSVLAPFALQASMLLKLSICHKTSEQMRELSITDSLTGLFNRRYFDVRLEEEFLRSKRYDMRFSLVIFDIDDFKLFNDTEGHLAGDQVMKELAAIMNSTVRANDIVVRLGGEEFAVIMPQTASEEAFGVAERIRQNTGNLITPAWKKFPRNRVSVSAGIAMYPECGEPMENIILHADWALYKAKTEGKDRSVIWRGGGDHERPSITARARFLRRENGAGAGKGFTVKKRNI
jgi:diguanylate cyclase (GGDEF)-like protein